jgi:hypothetical protein
MHALKAIALKIISALLFAVMSALVRFLGEKYPVGQIVFFRSAFRHPAGRRHLRLEKRACRSGAHHATRLDMSRAGS